MSLFHRVVETNEYNQETEVQSKKVSFLSFLFGLLRSLERRDEKVSPTLPGSSTSFSLVTLVSPFRFYYDKRQVFHSL